ncbi:MAG: mercuric transporter MerT family protein [Parvularculaceae bacterium]
MNDANENSDPTKGAGWLAGGGALSGFLALLGASCCLLPIVLVNFGIGGALVANLALFARYRMWFLGGALALVMAAVILAHRGGRRPRPRFWASVGAASFLILAAWIMPLLEGTLVRWLDR